MAIEELILLCLDAITETSAGFSPLKEEPIGCVVGVASNLRIRLRTCRWSVMPVGYG
jgi:hypothetical protein